MDLLLGDCVNEYKTADSLHSGSRINKAMQFVTEKLIKGTKELAKPTDVTSS